MLIFREIFVFGLKIFNGGDVMYGHGKGADFTLVLGPMKSGKSFDLISFFMPLQYSDIWFVLYQPDKNVRDNGIRSRNGPELKAHKIKDFSELLVLKHDIIGLDEIHMFEPNNVSVIGDLLKRGVSIFACGLDMDYRGKMFPVIKCLLELGPTKVVYKRAVCEGCGAYSAVYTQVYENNKPVLESLPSVLPEDGTYEYKPLCRLCFVGKK